VTRLEREGLCDCCIKYRHLNKNGFCFDCWKNPNCITGHSTVEAGSKLSDIAKVLQDSLGIDDDNKHR